MDTRDQIERLYQQQSELAAEINNIRLNCPHEHYVIAYYSWRIGTLEPRRICKACDFVLNEMPTYEELEKFAVDETAQRRESWARRHPDTPFPEALVVKAVHGTHPETAYVMESTNGGSYSVWSGGNKVVDKV